MKISEVTTGLGDTYAIFFVSWKEKRSSNVLYHLRDQEVLSELNKIKEKSGRFLSNNTATSEEIDQDDFFLEWKQAYLEHEACCEALLLADKVKNEISCSACLSTFDKDVWVYIQNQSYRPCGTDSIHALCQNCLHKLYVTDEDTVANSNFDFNTCIQCQIQYKGKWEKLI